MRTFALLLLLLAAPCRAQDDPLAALESQMATATIDAHEHHVHHEHHLHHVGPDGKAPPLRHKVGDEVHHHPEPHEEHEDHSPLEVFGFDFMRRAMFAGLLAGAICTWLGVFVVLRRQVFVAVALAQVASAGIALGVLAQVDPVLFGMLATILAAILTGAREERSDLPREAHMGLLYVAAGSLAILFLAKSGTGEAEQLEMLHGNLLIVTQPKLNMLLAAAAGILALHVLGWSRLIAVSFDPVTASVEGVSVTAWNFIFFLALGTGIGICVQSCGLLMVFAYLLVPPATGLLAGARLPGVLAIGMACQAAATIAGLWAAYELDLPGSPTIVVTLVLCLAATSAGRALARRILANA